LALTIGEATTSTASGIRALHVERNSAKRLLMCSARETAKHFAIVIDRRILYYRISKSNFSGSLLTN
jgi:hypothetical protein